MYLSKRLTTKTREIIDTDSRTYWSGCRLSVALPHKGHTFDTSGKLRKSGTSHTLGQQCTLDTTGMKSMKGNEGKYMQHVLANVRH